MLQEIKLRASNLADASSEVIMRGIIDSLNGVSNNTLNNNGPNKRPIYNCNCDYCRPLRMYTEFKLFYHHMTKLCNYIDFENSEYTTSYESLNNYIIFINNRFGYLGTRGVTRRGSFSIKYDISGAVEYYRNQKNLILYQTKNKGCLN